MTRLCWLVLALLPLFAAAQEHALVELELIPETVSVGEPATMRVTVLGPTWFAKPPVWPSFEVPNAVVRLPPDSSMPTTRRIDGEQWSGVVRDYEIYPLMPAQYILGGQDIRVSIAHPGSAPVAALVAVPELRLAATVPAGAEGLDPYVAGTNLSLERDIEGDTDSLEAGDAVVITTTAAIDGLRALFLPPMTTETAIEGVSIYPEEPVLEDGATNRRSERITLVFPSGGDYTLPGLSLDWWDRSTGSITTATLPELRISVAGPVAEGSSSASEGSEPSDWKTFAAWALGLAAILYGSWRLAGTLAAHLRRRAAEIQASEHYAFDRIRKACATGDARSAYRALIGWLGRLEPPIDARGLARQYGDDRLYGQLDALSARTYREPARDVDWQALRNGLEKARENFLAENDETAPASVPPLNP